VGHIQRTFCTACVIVEAVAEASALRDAFVAALPAAARPAFENDPELGPRLSALLEEAAAALGRFAASDLGFATHLGGIVPADGTPATFEKLRAADLYLAYACASGETLALSAFESEFGRDIDLAIARSGNVNLAKDEFRQLVRNKLFVATPGRRPKIADYAGRGDLRSWVRVTALRMIVDLVRQHAGDREVPLEAEALGSIPAPGDDPELDYIQRVYKTEFRDALTTGFQRLTARERNLLRHQVLHGLNIDQVGALYRVHRTTAFRWIEKARKSLLQQTREALKQQLHVGSGEFLSIMRVVQGDLEVSVRRLLVSDIEAEPSEPS
jgi:RNA polymerase sigma-70 factor, ECF subfamily